MEVKIVAGCLLPVVQLSVVRCGLLTCHFLWLAVTVEAIEAIEAIETTASI